MRFSFLTFSKSTRVPLQIKALRGLGEDIKSAKLNCRITYIMYT